MPDTYLEQKLGQHAYILQLSDWIDYLLARWEDWARGRGNDWLLLETGNPGFPTLGHFFRHAFTPLQRYSDQVGGHEPADDKDILTTEWPGLNEWARSCQQAHRAALSALKPDWLDREIEFKTRSAGVLKVSVGGALTHAATHCVWHLGGIVHLLRSRGIEPPGRSDLIFMLMKRD